MKHIICAALLAVSSFAASAKVDIQALEAYVYPNNSTASAALNFMPDGAELQVGLAHKPEKVWYTIV